MDSYQLIPLFIQMLKYTINTHFPSYKHFFFQNDGDLVMTQQVQVKPYLGPYDKKDLRSIVPIETYDVLLENARNFSSPFFFY